MSQRRILNILVVALTAILFSGIDVNGQRYSGQGFAGGVTIDVAGQPVVTSNVLDTGDIPANGIGGAGNITQSSLGNYTLPGGVLRLGDRTVIVTAPTGGNSSTAFASINNLNVGAFATANLVTAGVITSNTSAVCPNEVLSGGSTIAGLTIAGNPITVSGAPNQIEQVTVVGVATVRVVINEQIIHPRSITVNALHITITALDGLTEIDVIISSARSGINCAIAPTFDLYSGRGTAVRVDQNSLLIPFLSTIVADTGWLPSPGTAPGSPITSTTAGANVAGIVTTGAAFSSTEGGDPAGTTESSSEVDALGVNVPNPLFPLLGPASLVTLGADTVASNTQCQCTLSAPTCSGDSVVENLSATALGIPVTILLDFPPNTELIDVNIPLLARVRIVVNEQSVGTLGAYDSIDVTALRIQIEALADLVLDTDIKIAKSHSDIACAIAPSAASATLSGRVIDHNGRPISRAIISAMDTTGQVRRATTNTMGYYSINDLPAGEFYVVSASARGYTFSARTVSLNDSIAGFDLYPDSRQAVQVTPAPAPAKIELVTKQAAAASPIQRSPQRVTFISGSVFDSELPSKEEMKILQ